MTDPGTVLVLTQWFDPTADMVVEELNRRGVPVFRCDPGELPRRLTLAAVLGEGWSGSLHLPGRSVDLSQVTCAYYRRPTAFRYPAGVREADRRWATRESRAGLGGLLQLLPRWLNHPAAIGYAEYKPIQLDAAVRVGLTVPRTVLTNEPARAAAFAAEIGGQIVYKPLSGGLIAHPDRPDDLLYTTPLHDGQLADPGIGLAVHLFQERVAKDHELRITCVDGTLFTARIDARSDAGRIDWRADYQNIDYRPADLPAPVAGHVRRLMAELGLRFGAVDMIVTPDGEHVFLELNPNGQWGWIEEATGLPIATAIADALTGTDEDGDTADD